MSVVVVALFGGCGDDDASPDAGVDAGARDASVRVDGSLLPDAGGDADLPTMDGGGPDAGFACPGICDPVGGRCAAGACVLQGPEPMCVPMGGRIGEGEPCERTDQCMVGLACFRKREGGVCGRICCPASGAACDPEEEERCGGPGVLIDGSETEFGECLPPRACDVLADDACEPGESCYIVSSRGDTDCREAGEAEVGEDCEAPNDCAAGLTCSGFFEQTCVRICALEVEGSCPADEGTCVAYAQSPEGTGLCTLDATMMR